MTNPETSKPPAPYDILFEPVAIGPLVTRNRFFQVPHCNGMGYRDPSAEAAMRKVKAEGGWAVVCTEQVEIHPTSDITPFIELRIWDDSDLPALFRELADELPQWLGQFPETDPVGGPVVHLKVDVRRVAAAPGRP